MEFHPGLRIDYRVPQVEIDAEVVLREGALELFAYARAPVPKEHESILRTNVPVEKIYQALGLIGLTPGQPPRYLPETKTIRPASGDAVDVFVRLDRGGRFVEESACDWMWNVASKATMSRSHWLFCGSERLPDGRLAAQEEGTLVTVVDFPSSLLSLPTPHTDKDAELWLKAHTPVIPDAGTRVTLILRPAEKQPGSRTRPNA